MGKLGVEVGVDNQTWVEDTRSGLHWPFKSTRISVRNRGMGGGGDKAGIGTNFPYREADGESDASVIEGWEPACNSNIISIHWMT